MRVSLRHFQCYMYVIFSLSDFLLIRLGAGVQCPTCVSPCDAFNATCLWFLLSGSLLIYLGAGVQCPTCVSPCDAFNATCSWFFFSLSGSLLIYLGAGVQCPTCVSPCDGFNTTCLWYLYITIFFANEARRWSWLSNMHITLRWFQYNLFVISKLMIFFAN